MEEVFLKIANDEISLSELSERHSPGFYPKEIVETKENFQNDEDEDEHEEKSAIEMSEARNKFGDSSIAEEWSQFDQIFQKCEQKHGIMFVFMKSSKV